MGPPESRRLRRRPIHERNGSRPRWLLPLLVARCRIEGYRRPKIAPRQLGRPAKALRADREEKSATALRPDHYANAIGPNKRLRLQKQQRPISVSRPIAIELRVEGSRCAHLSSVTRGKAIWRNPRPFPEPNCSALSRRSAYVTATDRLAARLFGNRSVQPRLQTVDGDITRSSEKSANLTCVRFIGVSFHGHSQLRPVQESITLNRDLSQNVLKTRRNSGRALSPVSSQRGVLATRMRLVQTRQH